MNFKRLALSIVGVFVFVFFYEWVFHGVILRPIYGQTAALWRRPEDYIFPALSGGQFLTALFLCLIYARCCRTRGLKEGALFGLLAGLFASSEDLIMYAVQPLPAKLVVFWMVGGAIEMTLAGTILGALYRPPATAVPSQ